MAGQQDSVALEGLMETQERALLLTIVVSAGSEIESPGAWGDTLPAKTLNGKSRSSWMGKR